MNVSLDNVHKIKIGYYSEISYDHTYKDVSKNELLLGHIVILLLQTTCCLLFIKCLELFLNNLYIEYKSILCHFNLVQSCPH